MGVSTPVKEQWAAIQRWKKHQWTTKEAVQQLGVLQSTLMIWKKKYWSLVEPPPDVGDRRRVKGGGRKYKLAPYELKVLTFYDDCLRENGRVTFDEMMEFCAKIPAIAILKKSTHRSRIRRFMDRYNPNKDPAAAARAVRSASQVSGKTGTPSEKGASDECEVRGGDRISSTTSIISDVQERQDEVPDEDEYSNSDSDSDSVAELDDVELVDGQHVARADAVLRDCGSAGRGYELRLWQNANVPVAVHMQGTGASRPVAVSIPLFSEDLTSVKSGNALTCAVVDFCISRYTRSSEGIVFSVGSAVFVEINAAYASREKVPREDGHGITGEMAWNDYRYILLPVNLNYHWSLIVIESPSAGGKVFFFYHIYSLRGAHHPEYLFAVLQWFFSVVNSSSQVPVETQGYSYVTKLRQANEDDCGIYMMHYLYKINCYVNEHKPLSLAGAMETLTKSSFNDSSASRARASLYEQLMKTA